MHAAFRIVLTAAFVATSACGPRAADPPPRAEPAVVHEPIEDEPTDEDEWPEEPSPAAPALDDDELDAMDRPELEAACYAGSSAACDRLGH